MENIIVKVRPTKEAEFSKLVKKFNRCLKAAGLSEISPTLKGKCKIKIHNADRNLNYTVEGNEYTLAVPESVLKMGEYRFIGEYRKMDGKWYRTMHSDNVRDEYEVRESNMRCDHCGRDIKNRNGYYFFRKPTGELTVVGSTCVDAFMGFKVRELLEALGDATEFERNPGSADFEKEVIYIDIEQFLRLVCGATDGFRKWVKRGEENPTSEVLKSKLSDMFFGDSHEELPVIQDVPGMIDKVRDYWRTQVKFDDMTINSRKSVDGEYVPVKWADIAGWAMFKPLAMANGAMSRLEAPVANGYVGKVGDEMTMDLVPKKCFSFQNQWGDAWAIHFDDDNGNHYLTFTSSRGLANLVKGSMEQRLKFSFKITGQSIDRGRKVNKINYVKAVAAIVR